MEITEASLISQQMVLLVACCMGVYCSLECHIDIKPLAAFDTRYSI